MTRRSILGLVMLAVGCVLALLAVVRVTSGSAELDRMGTQLIQTVTELRQAEPSGDNGLRMRAAQNPAIGAVVILDRTGQRIVPEAWTTPTFAEQRLLRNLDGLSLPSEGAVAWIGTSDAETGTAVACLGGKLDVTCLILRTSDLMADAPKTSSLGGLGYGGAALLALVIAGRLLSTGSAQADPAVPDPHPPKSSDNAFHMEDLMVDPGALRAWRATDTEPIDLSAREMRLLQVLFRHPGEALSRDFLFDEVWGRDYMANSRALDQFVSKLRRKIEADASRPTIISTVRGVGYRFDPSVVPSKLSV